MARGWESKSVESQQIEERSQRESPLTPEERERQRKRAGPELSRRRVLADLAGIAASRSEVRRVSLEQALAFLDEEIKKLES